MYNEEQKIRFMKDCAGSITVGDLMTSIFKRISQYEEIAEKDICEFSGNEAQEVIDKMSGIRKLTSTSTLSVLKHYGKWCLENNIDGATDGILLTKIPGSERIKKSLVSGPLQLQTCLDAVFEPESEETIDCIYRCYFWLAFSGMHEVDAFNVKRSEVDLGKMLINHGEDKYYIYREGIDAFYNASTLNEFKYKHPNYSNVITRDRKDTVLLLSGIKATPSTNSWRSELSKRCKEKEKEGKLTVDISFKRVQLSGIFYRMYEKERAGIPVDFSSIIDNIFYKNSNSNVYRLRLIRSYTDDYERWKTAFSS